ncbi:S53 family peptidase [Kitasatospora kifunensis]|uniref:Subtilase family serine protease n=1 Tax=Kitasatospora kifunensis TaxID=58351 RepID=A0A7W7VXD9_KITKI|nr:S53 family peptidase [Kitasatospora kifunensis]MBB4926386.1 subtilase family serine protease [Kitasatospora kifunensis]
MLSNPTATGTSTSGTPTAARARRIALALTGTAALALSAFATAGTAGAATTAATVHSKGGTSWVRSCATLAAGDTMACNALKVTSVAQHLSPLGVTPNAAPSGYGPSDLRSAYNLPANGGAGQTVAIVDAYNDPNAESDLAVYRAQFGLPACTTANGCFKKVSQTGSTTSLPANNSGWAGEISLDLDMVSAIAPNAHIILVEAKTASTPNLGTAVNEAVKLGAKFVSNSYGGSESSSDPTYDSQYFNHPGVAITVSAGDSGYGVEYPAASKYVTSVGGTALTKDSSARGWSESVWNTSSTEGTGSGCSAYDAKPSWQKDTGCSNRTVADVSAVADPATGVAVYQTYGASGWSVYGGTSVASPLIAGVYADAGAPTVAVPAADAYAHPSALNDVTSGSTASCTPSYLCTAGPGYDGPTGLGTPNGLAAFTG